MMNLVACGSSTQEQTQQTNDNEQTSENIEEKQTTLGKTLVVYFSVPETSDAKNMTEEEENSTVIIDGEVIGNTQYVANVIHQQTKGDIFRIEPKTPYPTQHATLVDLAKTEQANNERPELNASIRDIAQYDTIFIGYPIWWSDLPMILYTFLDTYDFAGKQIIPFSTHGGSGFANTIKTITEQESNATVLQDGFTVSRDDVQNAEREIVSWLNDLTNE